MRAKLLIALFACGVWLSQSAFVTRLGFGTPNGGSVTLTDVTIAGTHSVTFTAPASANTSLGAIAVSATGGSFSGSLSLSGTNAASFHIVGSDLQTQASGPLCGSPPCTYSFNIVATQGGAAGSPLTQAFTGTGNAPGVLNTTLTLVNDSGSATTGGTPTMTFGMPFLDGDLCSGAAPIFKIGGVTQPFSASPANARRYWPSGCLMFSSFMLRPIAAVLGSNSATVAITAGSSSDWPAASSRTTTELYAQNLVFNAPATGATLIDATVQVTATLGSWLDSAANTNNNNYQQDVWLDGDAGKCWRIKTKMAPTKAGTGHVTLRMNHYVCALNNGSGTLGAFRWLGQMRNPVFDGASAPKAYWFHEPDSVTPTNGVNWTVCGGVGGCVAPAGAVSGASPPYMPYNTVTASVIATTNSCGNQPNILEAPSNPGYYTGNGYGNSLNLVPVYNKTTNHAYWAADVSGNRFQLSNGASSACGGFGGLAPVAGTYAPAIFIDAFNRVSFANQDGKYNFFQGTGSIATGETPLRVKINQTYWQSSKVFFPFDLHYQGVNNSDTCGAGSGCSNTVPEVTAAGPTAGHSPWTYNFSPYSIGDVNNDQSGAGDHQDIGYLQQNAFADFYNQTFLSDKVIRITGFGAGMLMYDLKDGATDNINTVGTGGGYTGLPSSIDGMCWAGHGGTDASNFGWNYPSNAIQTPISTFYSQFDHRPGFSLPWAYARTGELQYLDLLVDQSPATFYGICGERGTDPNIYYPVATNWTGGFGAEQPRAVAWGNRDVQYAALFYPFDPNNPNALSFEGTQTGKYLNFTADQSASYPYDQWNLNCPAVYGSACSYVTAAGRWSINKGTVLQRDGPLWENAYVVGSQIIAAIRHLGDSAAAGDKARAFVKLFGQRLKYEGDTEGYFHIYGYYQQYGVYFGSGVNQHIASSYYSDDEHYAISNIGTFILINWASAGARHFSYSSVGPSNGWVPANCDVIMTWIDGNHPSVMSDNVPYYITQLSGTAFNLTTDKPNCNATPGSVLTPVENGGMTYDYKVASAPTTTWPYVPNYVSALRTVASWGKAMGLDSANNGYAAVITDANFRLQNNTTQSGPGGACPCKPDDERYYTQDHFGP